MSTPCPLDSSESATRRVVRAACPHDCPDTCAMLVTVENGRAIEIRGAPDHPPTARHAVHEGRALPRPHVFARPRCCYPMRRVGAKGEGRFARISWDEALDEIADALRGDRRVAGRPAGDPAVQLRRHDGPAAGHRRWIGASSIGSARRCSTARSARPPARPAGRAVIGASMGMDVEQFDEQQADPDLGQQPGHVQPAFLDARAGSEAPRRASSIAIDPYRSATAEKCHEHIALLPGTDAALALGMMHVLIAEDLRRSRLRRSLHDRLRRARAARAREWPPERVAAICGIPARAGRSRLARDYGTTKPAAIRAQLRDAAHARRRQRRARHRLPAGAGRRVARSGRRRAAVVVGHVSRRHARRSSAPT